MITVAHTADLAPATLQAAKDLVYAVFEGDIEEEDWEHGLGGLHALAHADGELVGHASLVMRRMLHGGRALRTGYVEVVAVRADHRRHGLGGAVMAPLERAIDAAYDLGALGSSDIALPFYASRGWQPWRGTLSALTPRGVVPTPDELGGIFVRPVAAPLDLDGELTCDWRDGEVW